MKREITVRNPDRLTIYTNRGERVVLERGLSDVAYRLHDRDGRLLARARLEDWPDVAIDENLMLAVQPSGQETTEVQEPIGRVYRLEFARVPLPTIDDDA